MRDIEFKSGDDETVRGVLYEPTTPPPHPAIIFAHGLLSTHDEFGDYPARFCARGYLALAIDFRGHGASDGLRGLVSSARNVEDLRHALDFISAQPGVDPARLALVGHSLGGDAVLCTAARDARARAVVAGATVGRLRDELSPGEVLTYRIVSALNQLQKAITRQPLYVPYRVTYADIFADDRCRRAAEAKGFLQRTLPADNIPRLLQQDAYVCARSVRVPTLIVQGELDRVVKPASTRRVYDTLTCEKEWLELKGSGHSFATDGKGAEAFERIAAWLNGVFSIQSPVFSEKPTEC
jgi:dipeptidyl aminopeptidase/acylaminoacyl peptidase